MKVLLRALTLEDGERIFTWLTDPYLVQLTFVVSGPGGTPLIPFTPFSAKRYLDILVYDKYRRSFALEVNDKHVGNVGLKQYDPQQGTSECFIEIGESSYRGRGIGTAAMCMLLDYGFKKLNLREIRLEVLEFNHAAIRVYDRIGFSQTGVTGWHFDCRNQYWRVLGMSITSKHWKTVRGHINLAPGIVIAF